MSRQITRTTPCSLTFFDNKLRMESNYSIKKQWNLKEGKHFYNNSWITFLHFYFLLTCSMWSLYWMGVRIYTRSGLRAINFFFIWYLGVKVVESPCSRTTNLVKISISFSMQKASKKLFCKYQVGHYKIL